jgi:carbon storage regulator CsrA
MDRNAWPGFFPNHRPALTGIRIHEAVCHHSMPVLAINRDQVRIGIAVRQEVPVRREEIYVRIRRERQQMQ